MNVDNDDEEMETSGLTIEQRRERFGHELFSYDENSVWKVDYKVSVWSLKAVLENVVQESTETHQAYHCTTKELPPEVNHAGHIPHEFVSFFRCTSNFCRHKAPT